MKEIKLSQQRDNKNKHLNLVACVDDNDFEYLNQFKWYACKYRHTVYAIRNIKLPNGKKRTISMHRIILQLTNPKILCDHIDHNGLNNMRNNLRPVTYKQNSANMSSFKNSSSKYLGVSLEKKKYWKAQIFINNKILNLGYFTHEKDAALAYNKAALKFRGKFANQNVI